MSVGPTPYPPPPGMPMGGIGPQRPSAINSAFMVMLAGAGLTAVSTIVSVVFGVGAGMAMNDSGMDGEASGVMAVSAVISLIMGVFYIALWVWMAFACRAGHAYARILGTVFFGINTLFMLLGVFGLVALMGTDGATGLLLVSLGLSVLIWLMGLLATIMLWNRASTAYFNARAVARAASGYGPGYGPPQAPAYGPPALPPGSGYGNQPQPYAGGYGTPPPGPGGPYGGNPYT
ncbi:hypothetical protein [Spirillospora sp. CA-294931]|uniref:hypothetical protein n=1 Tax=Spirillospora sp. CA-294931 TaxID=3240042 RepID=UPI003D94A44A